MNLRDHPRGTFLLPLLLVLLALAIVAASVALYLTAS